MDISNIILWKIIYYIFLLLEILYKTTDICNKINPIINEHIAVKTEGSEKFPVILKIDIEYVVNPKPINNKIIPGIPRYFNGWWIAMDSSKEPITLIEWDMGSFVDVFKPVS